MSDIRQRKVKTYFSRLDFEKKGVITKKDFEMIPIEFARKENASSDLLNKATKAFDDVRYFTLIGNQ